jgi:D-amino-acid dehydrogenase
VSRDVADVVVVGGGLVGAACAFELAGRGLAVTVVDRHDAGRATDAGAGILSPETMGGLPESFLDLADLAGAHHRALGPELADLGAPDPAYASCGALRVAVREGDDDIYAVNVAASTARHPGVLEPLDPDAARAAFPPLGPVRAAVWNPRGARVDGRALTAALVHGARARGTEWLSGDVTGVRTAGGRVLGVDTAAGPLAAGTVVVAGGAWTPAVAADLGLRAGVRPVRGQIVHLGLPADTAGWPVLQPILSHYVVAWPGGRVALGATVEDAGFDARVTAGGLAGLLAEGVRVSPGLADATVLETRVGLRPVSDDDLPIVGPVPAADGVVVATGLGANGLLLGPVTGRLVADLVTGAPPPLDLASFAPARLGPT